MRRPEFTGQAGAAEDVGRAVGRASVRQRPSPVAVRAAEPVRRAVVLHDAEQMHALVRSLLEASGFAVTSAPSVLQLAASDAPEAAQLCVLGLSAVGDGDLEIVSILRRRAPHAWILVLHPASLRERAAQALALGADASLAEPFYPLEVTAQAQRALARNAPSRDVPAVSESPAATPAPDRSADPGPQDADAGRIAARLADGVAQSLDASLAKVERQLGAAETDGEVDVPALRAELRGISGLAAGLARYAGRGGDGVRPTDVAALVTGVFMSRDVGAAGAEIGVRLGDARVEVLADPDLLRAALESVRNRAVRVTPPEGRISVRTRSRVEDGRPVVEISVTDAGPALPADERVRMFEPFPDEPSVHDGTGLELAGLAGVVRGIGGTVTALAAGATGTIVVIRLPVNGA